MEYVAWKCECGTVLMMQHRQVEGSKASMCGVTEVGIMLQGEWTIMV
jgi:hypothetical protein